MKINISVQRYIEKQRVARVISMTQGNSYEALLPIPGLKRMSERPGIWRLLLIIILIKMRVS